MKSGFAFYVAICLVLAAHADRSSADQPQKLHLGASAPDEPSDEVKQMRLNWAQHGAQLALADKVRERVRSHLRPRDPGTPGYAATLIEVRLADDGKITSATLLRSSGYPEWDENAMAAVRAASPLPPNLRKFRITVQADCRPAQP
ncbi:TonB family protein [Paraburkholderia acidiphila]|uniref:TonB family protein n=2 Tax=Paraburkholderia acidiphila TaxID=2571747 RepID=A0A7Z2J856_9BURK|nr:TonB family protein [Paraburkholderia acidiphila]